ncbi:MAG: glycosyltransferase, partial [Nitrospirae bacterium]|nr:glycosyltransferase [Nitrospirota bacterium]
RSFLSRRTYREVKFSNREFGSLLRRLLDENGFDVVWVNFLNMATYLDGYLAAWSGAPGSRPLLLMDQHNLDEYVWKKFAEHIRNPLYRIFCSREAAKNRRLQEAYFPLFDLILSVSEFEKAMTEKYNVPSGNVMLAPNGVDVEYFKPRPDVERSPEPTIVFGGSLDAAMNQDAVHWLESEIFPRVRKRMPSVRLLIAGRNPPPSIMGRAGPAVDVVADPPDIRDCYDKADVFVVPLRSGGGTKLKTLEAMAMALPVVSTSTGAQGLNVTSGEHLLVADEAGLFADRIVELLRDPVGAERMARNARRFVEENFSWDSIVGSVEEALIRRLGSA